MTRRDHDVTAAVREFLGEGPTKLPDSVFTAVMDAVPVTRQRRGFIARFAGMQPQLAAGGAAAILAAVAIAASMIVGGSWNVGDPDPSPTGPDASGGGTDVQMWAAAGEIPPGTYFADEPFPVRVTMTLPDGFELFTAMHREVALCLGPCGDVYAGIEIWVPEVAATDACDASAGLIDPFGEDADEVVAYLGSHELLDASPPEPSIIGGHPATYLETAARDEAAGCIGGSLRLFGARTETGQLVHHLQEPGYVDRIWVLEVDGVTVVIDVIANPTTTEQEVELMREVVESMRIEPAGG